MRRRDVIAGAGAALLASPSVAAESTTIPAELPDGTREIAQYVNLPDKRRLLRLVDRPPNYASPVDVFTDVVTPNDRFYVRYHLAGVPSADDMDGWTLSVAGDAVKQPVRLKMSDLLDLPSNDVLSVCQCAGNRRGLVDPHVAGVQWTDGGMGCAVWSGPALRDVLKVAGVKPEALEVWLGGADKPVMDGTPPFRKSIPMEKALDGDTIVAIAMNNAPLPQLNGYPARLVVPGWVGTYWMKHLTSIEVSSSPLKNFWMQTAYRVPAGLFPVTRPFQSQATPTTVPITELVVNSLIADPLEGQERERSGFNIQGIAWDRGAGIDRVEVSIDGGANWQDALLDRPLGPYAYRRFLLQTELMRPGTYRLMSRATSHTGERQAERFKANPGGYHNNVPRPIAVTVV
ncbi:molybdopterin-dependent oxidoreductase [Acidisphaera sp. S103]|uniref:molybdopterin-dependent oxidoreductase n=1 Tax=Acidisphaera sp. S103 TaxID=1747223 RepID=UPI00131DA5DC|nr:molybdopterin-dependent oxidoreductase [Acidisphaera sp. S103]